MEGRSVFVLIDEVARSSVSGKARGLLHDSRRCASRGLKCRLRNGKSNQPRAFFVDTRSFHRCFVSTLSICLPSACP